jgi:hypothetical protein
MSANDIASRLAGLLLRIPRPTVVLEMRAALVLDGPELDWRWVVRGLTVAEQQRVLRDWHSCGPIPEPFIAVQGGFLALVEGERPRFTRLTAEWAVRKRANLEWDAFVRLTELGTPHIAKDKDECSPE